MAHSQLQPYPLYDLLLARVQESRQLPNLTAVCSSIRSLTRLPVEQAQAHYEEIGALILHHELITNSGVLLHQVPYRGETMYGDNGILHHLPNLPTVLQQLLTHYISEYS